VLADLISDTLGLSTGNGIVLSTARRDKAQMQVVIAAAGLRSLRSQNCLSAEQALAFVCEQQLRWPVVLKPAQAAGSAGVSICQTEGDVRRCFSDLATYGHVWPGSAYPVSGLVVQECAHGEEFVVNIASRDGQHKVTDVWRCEKQGDLAFMRETLVQSSDDVQDVIAYTKRCLDALGFRNGASHTEVMRTSDGVVLLELNPRFQGTTTAPRHAPRPGGCPLPTILPIDTLMPPWILSSTNPLEGKLFQSFAVITLTSDDPKRVDADYAEIRRHESALQLNEPPFGCHCCKNESGERALCDKNTLANFDEQFAAIFGMSRENWLTHCRDYVVWPWPGCPRFQSALRDHGTRPHKHAHTPPPRWIHAPAICPGPPSFVCARACVRSRV
jgi:hypothetical protein